MKISLKRIKCILTGGCKFKSSDTESKCNDKKRPVPSQKLATNAGRSTLLYSLTNS